MNRAAWSTAAALAALMVAGSAAAQEYDKRFRNDFMRNCITSGGTYTVCQCTMLQIESQIEFAAFARVQTAVRGGAKADQATLDQYEKIIDGCVERDRQ